MDMVRVNTRISKKANDWLDEQSRVSGVPKSTLILLSIESYMSEKESTRESIDIAQLAAKIDQLEQSIKGQG